MSLVIVIECDVADCNTRADCEWEDGLYPYGQWDEKVGAKPAGWVDDGFTAPEGWKYLNAGRFVCPLHDIEVT